MKIYGAIVTDTPGHDESLDRDQEFFAATTPALLLVKLQMFFVSYWSDNQVATDAETLRDARAYIQRFLGTKSIHDLQMLLVEVQTGFVITEVSDEL